MNEKQPRSRKKKPFPVKAVAVAAAVLVVCAGSGIGYYVYQAQQYNHVFFPNTVINGMDVSKKTVDQVKEMIASGIQGYSLVLKERGGDTEEIFGAEIDLKSEFDGSLENYLAAQEPMTWFSHRSKKTEYEIPTMIAYDKTKLSEKIDGLVCLREDYAKAPVDAYMSEYQPGIGFSIIPEEQGNLLKKDVLTEGVVHAIDNLSKELDLEELDAYEKPEITSDHEELKALADKLNRYVNMTVTYQFGDSRETLGGDVISQWISVGADGTTVLLDRDQVAAYVKGLASKYDTAYKSKTLNTSYGKTVTISKGFYGWKINQGEETSQLYDIIQSGESQTREPVYSQKANSHGANDYGNTYVEINLTAQHLFFYKDGKLVIESDFVSGNHAKGYDTPSGAYPLTYKQKDATLKGENYRTPVSYWMPFNGNIGMHDAKWRSSFGGQIYMTNGSHGCVNLPPAVAKVIFQNISTGDPVLCYHLDGTGSKSTSTGTRDTQAETKAAETTAAPTQAETTAAASAPSETTAPAPSPAPEPTTAAAPSPQPSPAESSAAGPHPDPAESSPAPSPSETTAAESKPSGPDQAVFETTREIGPGV